MVDLKNLTLIYGSSDHLGFTLHVHVYHVY